MWSFHIQLQTVARLDFRKIHVRQISHLQQINFSKIQNPSRSTNEPFKYVPIMWEASRPLFPSMFELASVSRYWVFGSKTITKFTVELTKSIIQHLTKIGYHECTKRRFDQGRSFLRSIDLLPRHTHHRINFVSTPGDEHSRFIHNFNAGDGRRRGF